jgi:hypothetical protein
MGEVVNLPNSFIDNDALVVDLARFSEGSLTEKQVRRRHKLMSEADWEKMSTDESLCGRIEDEKIRRIRDGSCKRERAQVHVAEAPRIMADIMNDGKASPKHKIDEAKVLDQFAANGAQAGGPDASRFIISIQIGDVVEVYNKSIAVTTDDPLDVHDVNLSIDQPENKDNDGQHI